MIPNPGSGRGSGSFGLKVLERRQQHAETLTILLTQMLVVNLMRSTDALGVPVVGVSKHLKTLMDKDVVHQEVGHTIGEDSQAYGQSCPKVVILPGNEAADAYCSIKKEKEIVAFPPATMVFFMMILMKGPQKAMHDILVGKPSHELHHKKGGQINEDPINNGHKGMLSEPNLTDILHNCGLGGPLFRSSVLGFECF